MTFLKCAVYGLGYIGLPTATILANAGHEVVGIDTNPKITETIRAGHCHIQELDLANALSSAVKSGHFTVACEPQPADVHIITVPTPLTEGNFEIPQPDIQYVLSATRAIASTIKKGDLVILESTSPVGTTEKVANLLGEISNISCDSFYIAYCPERVLPGNILYELTNNDRVIGGLTHESSSACKLFIETFCSGQLTCTTARTAELVKLTENAFRDVNIAFANEISMVCDNLDVDVLELIRLANHHPRVDILRPGCGVGGHCIAVDPWFIAAAYPTGTALIQKARHVNSYKTEWTLAKIEKFLIKASAKLKKPVKVACMGLAFKPNVDDLRGSPAVHIVSELLRKGYLTVACEPHIADHPYIPLVSVETAITESDIIVYLVPHTCFAGLDTANKLIFDPCSVIAQVATVSG